MKNFEQLAQQVWAEPDVHEKRNLVNEMINQFQYKDKAETFRDVVANASKNKLDKLAADLMLRDGNKVI